MTKLYNDNAPSVKLDTVSEVVLKRRKSAKRDIIRVQRQRSSSVRLTQKKFIARNKGPAHFIINAKKVRYDRKRISNIKNKKSPLFLSDSPKLGVVIRLGGFSELSEKIDHLFKSLRLDTFNQAVFVKIDKRMLKKLVVLKPYIAWGYPSVEIVNELVSKRAWMDLEGKRVKVTDNMQIEQYLGASGILCVADLVHEIVNVTDKFDVAVKFLWPFKLLSIPAGWLGRGNERKHVRLEPGAEDIYINDLLKRIV